MSREERFEEKNRLAASISPDIGRYQPKYEVIHKNNNWAIDYKKNRQDDYQFELKFEYDDSRLGCEKQWEAGLTHSCKKTDCYKKWISKKRGCSKHLSKLVAHQAKAHADLQKKRLARAQITTSKPREATSKGKRAAAKSAGKKENRPLTQARPRRKIVVGTE